MRRATAVRALAAGLLTLVVVLGGCGGTEPRSPTPTRADNARRVVGQHHPIRSCFRAPGACGYPDPAAGNVGVPGGTTMKASGSLAVSTPGQVISGLDVKGSIEVATSNVTIENTRVTAVGGGCGPRSACGNYDIVIDPGATGVRLSHDELRVAAGTTVEHAIRNDGDSTLKVDHAYVHGPDSGLLGEGTVSDSWMRTSNAIVGDHIEDTYTNNGTLRLIHDTLLNPHAYTSVVFGNVNGGAGGPCSTHFTIRHSLLAGGGYLLQLCGSSSSVGSSTSDVEDNRIARCRSGRCPNGHGYFRRGGYYGVAAYTYCRPTAGHIWRRNVWDDNGANIAC